MENSTEFGTLRGSKIRKAMPRQELASRLCQFFKECNVCVLATCLNDVPRATPIEYYAGEDMALYMTAATATKLVNVQGNPRISVGIYNTPHTDWTDWYRVRGVQLTGQPEILRYSEQPEAYAAALQVYNWRPYRTALGKPDAKPMNSSILKIIPTKIEYRDLGLMREGYSATQVWETE